MGLINKRLRALRKKYNRITQMEESISQGKTLNKEQEEVLRSKPAVVILIDELEKIRAPLSAAVTEEISLATQLNRASSDQTTASEQKEVTDIPLLNGGEFSIRSVRSSFYRQSYTNP